MEYQIKYPCQIRHKLLITLLSKILFLKKKRPPTAAIVDTFGDKNIYLDHRKSVSHGPLVEAFVKSKCPSSIIIEKGKFLPTTEIEHEATLNKARAILENGGVDRLLFGESAKLVLDNPTIKMAADFNLVNALNEIREKIDVVNISLGVEVKITDLAKATGFPLTDKNLIDYKDKVRLWIKNNNSPMLKNLNEELESIEKFTSREIPVYVGAGNQGKERVNLFSFAKGVATVGALKEDGVSKADYTVDNSLVDKWETGDYQIKQLLNESREIGYDFTGDNKIDLLKKDIPSNKFSLMRYIFGTNYKLRGTSSSAPVAAGKYLNEKYGEECHQ